MRLSRFVAPLIAILASSPAFALEKCPELVKVERGGETTYWTKSHLAGEYPLSWGDSLSRPLEKLVSDDFTAKSVAAGSVARSYAKKMARALTKLCSAQLGGFVFDIPTLAEVRALEKIEEYREIFPTENPMRSFHLNDRQYGLGVFGPVPMVRNLETYYIPATKKTWRSNTYAYVRYRAVRK